MEGKQPTTLKTIVKGRKGGNKLRQRLLWIIKTRFRPRRKRVKRLTHPWLGIESNGNIKDGPSKTPRLKLLPINRLCQLVHVARNEESVRWGENWTEHHPIAVTKPKYDLSPREKGGNIDQ
jgi:hypothetical protein